jgi:DNA repair protein RadA/Sms
MARRETVFFCTECGYEVSKWTGVCPGCHAFNTMTEAPRESGRPAGNVASVRRIDLPKPLPLSAIPEESEERISTGMEELDRVLGGGVVSGALILTGGDPGIGKSTLLLQAARNMAAGGKKILYISGEESLRQIKLRARRLGEFPDELRFLCETSLDAILKLLQEEKPAVVVIDSIQTMMKEDVSGTPGSPSQVRECTAQLLQTAKSLSITVFIIGHVTKEGTVAGPRMLEHMVDTVLYFEGDRHASYRILRGVKNRFGAVNEIGVFEMRSEGLAEVPNPSAFLLSGSAEQDSGSVVSCVIEGTRPLLLEVQGLVSRSAFGMARRTAAGVDYNRVNLLLAVLEKRCRLSLSDCDAYVNIAGGLRVNDPALDLAVILALYSSYRNLLLPPHLIVFGEVGLSGELRDVPFTEQRVQEALRLGYTSCLLPRASLNRGIKAKGMKLIGAAGLDEAIRYLHAASPARPESEEGGRA